MAYKANPNLRIQVSKDKYYYDAESYIPKELSEEIPYLQAQMIRNQFLNNHKYKKDPIWYLGKRK